VKDFKDIVVVAWNGEDIPLKFISMDEPLNFRLFLFNYKGTSKYSAQIPAIVEKVITKKTEFKGRLIEELSTQLKDENYRYVGILDDDLEISISGINTLLKVAASQNADVFQPSISPDSYYSHKQFLNKSSLEFEQVDWVEIMSPFIRKEIFEAGTELYAMSISSYGIDKYVFPYLQYKLNRKNTILIHAVKIKHLKPVTDGSKIFSNGLDARQEGERLRKYVKKNILNDKIPIEKKRMKSMFGSGLLNWQTLKYNFKRILNI
jgi:hypothetical protein